MNVARMLLALMGVGLAALVLRGTSRLFAPEARRRRNTRLAVVLAGWASMACGLMGQAITGSTTPWVELLLLGIAIELGFVAVDTVPRWRKRGVLRRPEPHDGF